MIWIKLEVNWLTGVSSPWVENYIVKGINSEGNGQSIFEIEFEMVTSAGEAGKVTVELIVQQKNSKWLITSIKVVKDTENLGQIILPSDNPIEP